MAKICSFVFWYFKYLSGCLLWNSVHVFHCFSTMDEAGPALRLLKRRLKPVSRAELRVGEVRDRGDVGDSWRGLHSGKIQFSDAMFWRFMILPTIMIIMEVENVCSCTNWFFFSIQDGFIFHFRNERVREIQLGRWKVLEICEALPASPRHEEGTAAAYEKKTAHNQAARFFFQEGLWIGWLVVNVSLFKTPAFERKSLSVYPILSFWTLG